MPWTYGTVDPTFRHRRTVSVAPALITDNRPDTALFPPDCLISKRQLAQTGHHGQSSSHRWSAAARRKAFILRRCRGDRQSSRKSYKTSHFVGWVVSRQPKEPHTGTKRWISLTESRFSYPFGPMALRTTAIGSATGQPSIFSTARTISSAGVA